MIHRYYSCPDDEQCISIPEYMKKQQKGEEFNYAKWENSMQWFWSTWLPNSIQVEPESISN